MTNAQPTGCPEAKELIHRALDAGDPALPAEVQSHLSHCPACRSAWRALRQLEADAFQLAAMDQPEILMPDAFCERVMDCVAREDPPVRPRSAHIFRRSAFAYAAVAATVAAVFFGAITVWQPDRIARPDPPVDTMRLAISAPTTIPLSSAQTALASLPATASIKDARSEVANTAQNLLAPALSFGRLVDREFDTHLGQLWSAFPAG